MLPLSAQGPTLVLRYPQPEDASALFDLTRDPQVMRFFSWRWGTEEEAATWIAGRPAARDAGEWLEFVVEHRERGVAGVTGLTEPSRRDRRAVTGSWLGRDFWGTGVNDEAKALLARVAFEACGLERLGSYASTDNPRSRRALEKLGFVREGTLRRFHRHGDRVHDVDAFSMLPGEWRDGPLGAIPGEVRGEAPPAFRALGPAEAG